MLSCIRYECEVKSVLWFSWSLSQNDLLKTAFRAVCKLKLVSSLFALDDNAYFGLECPFAKGLSTKNLVSCRKSFAVPALVVDQHLKKARYV